MRLLCCMARTCHSLVTTTRLRCDEALLHVEIYGVPRQVRQLQHAQGTLDGTSDHGGLQQWSGGLIEKALADMLETDLMCMLGALYIDHGEFDEAQRLLHVSQSAWLLNSRGMHCRMLANELMETICYRKCFVSSDVLT